MTRCFNNESLYHSCLKRPAGGCVWLGSHNLQEGPLATAHWGTMGSSRQLELEITPDWTRDLDSHSTTFVATNFLSCARCKYDTYVSVRHVSMQK